MDFPLTGPSIALRPFRLDDIGAAHLVYNDPQVMRWVGHGAVRSIAGTESIVSQFIAHQRTHGFGFWAVIDRETGAFVGDAGLAWSATGEVEMGYTLGRSWWGRGIATEAGTLCLQAARGPLHIERVRALVEAPNAASRHVLEKLGFTAGGETTAFGRPHLVYRRDLQGMEPGPPAP